MGLNENYENIHSRILMNKNIPSLFEVYNILDQEASQIDAHSTSTDITAAAFQVFHNKYSTKSSQSGGSYSGNSLSVGQSTGAVFWKCSAWWIYSEGSSILHSLSSHWSFDG